MRRNGGSVGGGCRRGGSPTKSSAVASVTRVTARSKASSVWGDVDCTPLTLRTYWRAAASISSGVASGFSPRSVVMFRHMRATLGVDRVRAPGDTGAGGDPDDDPASDRCVLHLEEVTPPVGDDPSSAHARAVSVRVVDLGRYEDHGRSVHAVIGLVGEAEVAGVRGEGVHDGL